MKAPKLVVPCLSLLEVTSAAFAQEESTLPELRKKERKAIEKEIQTYYQAQRKGWGPVRLPHRALATLVGTRRHRLTTRIQTNPYRPNTKQRGC